MPALNTTGVPFNFPKFTPGVPMSTLEMGNTLIDMMNQLAMHKPTFDPPKAGQEKGPAELAGGIEALVDLFVPAGTILQWSAEEAPAGFLLCDGAAYSRTERQRLYQRIGVRFGVGDGSTTFNVPDMRGKFPLGFDANLGSIGGEPAHKTTEGEMPLHSHTKARYYGEPGTVENDAIWARVVNGVIASSPLKTEGAGGNVAHNNMPPWLALAYIIKT